MWVGQVCTSGLQSGQVLISYCTQNTADRQYSPSIRTVRSAWPRPIRVSPLNVEDERGQGQREREWKMLPLLLQLLQLPRCPPSEVFAACNGGGRFRPVSHRPTLPAPRPRLLVASLAVYLARLGCARCLPAPAIGRLLFITRAGSDQWLTADAEEDSGLVAAKSRKGVCQSVSR